MRKRWNSRQRVAMSIAVAVAGLIVGRTAEHLLWGAQGGWFAYAPNTSLPFVDLASDATLVARGAYWLAVTAITTAIVLRLLRDDEPG